MEKKRVSRIKNWELTDYWEWFLFFSTIAALLAVTIFYSQIILPTNSVDIMKGGSGMWTGSFLNCCFGEKKIVIVGFWMIPD